MAVGIGRDADEVGPEAVERLVEVGCHLVARKLRRKLDGERFTRPTISKAGFRA
jgi:hypothetical protein